MKVIAWMISEPKHKKFKFEYQPAHVYQGLSIEQLSDAFNTKSLSLSGIRVHERFVRGGRWVELKG
jgi:hypothetical protein